MKIAIDLRWIRSEKIDGISRYALNLVSHLLEIDTENQYVFIGNQTILQRYTDFAPCSTRKVISNAPPLLSIQDFLLTQRLIKSLDVDIFHVPNYLSSPLSPAGKLPEYHGHRKQWKH